MNRYSILTSFVVSTVLALGQTSVRGEDALPEGAAVVERVNSRDDGAQVRMKSTMTLRDKSGNERVRETVSYRKYYGADKKTLLIFTGPANIRDTGFLTIDYGEPGKDDDQWLYLPAARKVRRISASDRGDSFVGTDFTYEDMKKESKISAEDFTFKTIGAEDVEGHRCYQVEAVPVDDATAKELGYARAVSWFDAEIWISRKTEYFGKQDKLQRTILSQEIREADGIWTAHRVTSKTLKTGHTTVFEFTEVDYTSAIEDDLFTERSLARGARGN